MVNTPLCVSNSGKPTRAAEPAGRDDYQPRDQQADWTRLQAGSALGCALAGRETDPAGVLVRELVSVLDWLVCVLVEQQQRRKEEDALTRLWRPKEEEGGR